MLQLFTRNQKLLLDDLLKKVNQAECTVQRQFSRSLLWVEASQTCVHAYNLPRDDRAPARRGVGSAKNKVGARQPEAILENQMHAGKKTWK